MATVKLMYRKNSPLKNGSFPQTRKNQKSYFFPTQKKSSDNFTKAKEHHVQIIKLFIISKINFYYI